MDGTSRHYHDHTLHFLNGLCGTGDWNGNEFYSNIFVSNSRKFAWIAHTTRVHLPLVSSTSRRGSSRRLIMQRSNLKVILDRQDIRPHHNSCEDFELRASGCSPDNIHYDSGVVSGMALRKRANSNKTSFRASYGCF